MKRFLAPILLMVFLFPSFALGVGLGDLVQRGGLYYEKFTDAPFPGEVTGKIQGQFKDGKREGPWIAYYITGQLEWEGTFKDGKKDGPWVGYKKDGTVWEMFTGTFKDGEKVK